MDYFGASPGCDGVVLGAGVVSGGTPPDEGADCPAAAGAVGFPLGACSPAGALPAGAAPTPGASPEGA